MTDREHASRLYLSKWRRWFLAVLDLMGRKR